MCVEFEMKMQVLKHSFSCAKKKTRAKSKQASLPRLPCTYGFQIKALRLSNQRMKYLSTTPDFREGPLAFTEKRAPVWTGTAGVDKAKL